MTLLAISDLSLTFGSSEGPVQAVKNVSLTLDKGEMLAIVGESGSGKSLTALSVLGLQPESAAISGNIQFNGEEMIGAPETVLRTIRGKKISMIFQEPMTALNPLHTIGRQIGEMLTLHQKVTPPEARRKIEEVLEQVGLAHFKDRLDAYPHQLSGGERQRVMIAMAIINRPDILIADEPTTAVDVTIQLKILALLKDLQKTMGMSILFITHDLTIVRRLADKVAVMRAGEVVEQGKVSDIFVNPKHDYTKMLLASEPKGTPQPVAKDAPSTIACEDLKVHFPIKKGLLRRTVGYVKAVDGVSVSIPRGATLGVVGESGSGKTTLAFALLRLIHSQGPIVFLSQDIDRFKTSEMRTLRDKMQLVFQDPFASLNPRMTIRQIIEEGLLVHARHLSEAERVAAIDRILTEVGLQPAIKSRYPHEFSGGQRQRISIARAMVLRPAFVVLDEPTSALDLTVQAQIVELLKEFQKTHGLSYMFISHDLRVVKAISHRIVVMYRGKIVEENDTKTLFDSPKQDYTRHLIEAAFIAKA